VDSPPSIIKLNGSTRTLNIGDIPLTVKKKKKLPTSLLTQLPSKSTGNLETQSLLPENNLAIEIPIISDLCVKRLSNIYCHLVREQCIPIENVVKQLSHISKTKFITSVFGLGINSTAILTRRYDVELFFCSIVKSLMPILCKLGYSIIKGLGNSELLLSVAPELSFELLSLSDELECFENFDQVNFSSTHQNSTSFLQNIRDGFENKSEKTSLVL
jgi:hypothetical protein